MGGGRDAGGGCDGGLYIKRVFGVVCWLMWYEMALWD